MDEIYFVNSSEEIEKMKRIKKSFSPRKVLVNGKWKQYSNAVTKERYNNYPYSDVSLVCVGNSSTKTKD